MHCERCDDPVYTPGLCDRCALACTCPECGAAQYDPDEHYACDACIGGAVAKGTTAGVIVLAIHRLISESASRLSIIGRLMPRLFKFLCDLHDTIVGALREERMAAELDALDEKDAG